MQHRVVIFEVDRGADLHGQHMGKEDEILLVHHGVLLGRGEGLAGNGGHVDDRIRAVPDSFAGDLAM